MKWKLSSFNIVIGKIYRAYPVAQWVKNPPAMQESQGTWVWSLSQEELLEKGMTTHSSILAWKITWSEETGGLWPMGSQRVDTAERACVCACAHTSLSWETVVVKESFYKHRSQFVCKVLFSINSIYSKTQGHKIKKLG